MRSNQERSTNIYNKIEICNKVKKKRIKKTYLSISVLACILIAFIFIPIQTRNYKVESITKENSKIIEETIGKIPTSGSDFNMTLDADAIPTIIFNGHSYTFDGSINYEEKNINKLLGKYLGNASGSLFDRDEAKKIYASIVATGKIYGVNNYNENFRICILDKENSIMVFYDNLDEDNLINGKDLFGKLFLKNDYKDVLYQPHYAFMNSDNDFRECLDLNKNDIDDFIDELYESPFVKLTPKDQMEKIPDYDTEGDEIRHLYFKMDDGTTIDITLFKNGYVHYRDMGGVYVYIQDEIFDKIFNATSD
jgi:hypothetical protein